MLFIMLYKVVLYLLSLWIKCESVTIQTNVFVQYFPTIVFVSRYSACKMKLNLIIQVLNKYSLFQYMLSLS